MTPAFARREDDADSLPSGETLRRARRLGVVLIADDTVDAREMYSFHLSALGFTVVTASDGEEAIGMALAQRPDIIVMDLSMPRVDGLTAVRRLKQDARTKGTPVILLTGYPLRAIEQGVLGAGVDVFLTKPCLPEDLEANVRRLLERSSP